MRTFRWSPATEAERLKYEVADELGLLDKLLSEGWAGLTSEETGRVGGLVAKRLAKDRDVRTH